MAAQEMTVTVKTKSLFPSFTFSTLFCGGGFVRARNAVGDHLPLVLAWLRVGNWLYYYCNDPQIVVRAEGGRAQIGRLFASKKEAE